VRALYPLLRVRASCMVRGRCSATNGFSYVFFFGRHSPFCGRRGALLLFLLGAVRQTQRWLSAATRCRSDLYRLNVLEVGWTAFLSPQRILCCCAICLSGEDISRRWAASPASCAWRRLALAKRGYPQQNASCNSIGAVAGLALERTEPCSGREREALSNTRRGFLSGRICCIASSREA